MVPTKSLSLVHLVQEPRQTPAAGEKSPLLLLLHGVGSNEMDLIGLAEYLDPRFLVVSARSPLTLGPGSYGWYPVLFTPQGAVGDTRNIEEKRRLLVRFLEEAVAAYDADPADVYLMGFSQGAIMSLFTALTAPQRIAGAVIMSGRLLPEAWENRGSDEELRDLPILAVHGLYDNVLRITEGREIRDKLSTLPVALEYREYPMGHEVSRESLDTIADWLQNRLGAKK